ncbi:MAG: DUF3793 family protein [Clostridia bacterium]|nr:DUF3793 family protein [Clostridia bacterium]
MIDETVVRLCAPTLAGIKTGSLFAYHYKSETALQEEINTLNKRLENKGLRFIILRLNSGRALIYLYRPKKLQRDLKNSLAITLLKNAGYPTESCEKCIEQLIKRLSLKGFPHEIGLFLSYPPEDVKGFIEKKAADYKCVGCWKVYGDEKKAKAVFEKYKTCTDIYCQRRRRGKCLEELAVAI